MKLKKLTAVVASMLVVAMNVPTIAMADMVNEAAQVKYFTPEVLLMAEEEVEESDDQNSNDDAVSSEEPVTESENLGNATEVVDETEVSDVEETNETLATDTEVTETTEVTEVTEATEEVVVEDSKDEVVTEDILDTEVDSTEAEEVIEDTTTAEVTTDVPAEVITDAEDVVIEEETIIIVDSFEAKDAVVQSSNDKIPVISDDKITTNIKKDVNVDNEGEGGFGSIDIFADVDSGLDIDDVIGDVVDVEGAVGDSITDDSTVDVPVTDAVVGGTNSTTGANGATDGAINTPTDNPLTDGSVSEGFKLDKELFYEEVVDDSLVEGVNPDDSVITVPAKPVLKGAAGFVSRIYTIALNRDYEQAGLDYWVGELESNTTDGFEIFKRITDCPEFKDRRLSDADYLEVLYTTFFDRQPDGAGFDYWKDKLTSDPMYTREFVLECFVDSVEWANICKKYGIKSGSDTEPTILVITSGCKKFVERLYSTCLSREADQNGLDYWCSEIASSNFTGKFAAFSFITSPEFCELAKNMSGEELVTTFYNIFFGRAPEEAGIEYWVGELTSGEPTAVLFNGFSDSPEFAKICEDNGIVAGPSIVMDTTIKYDPTFEKFMSAHCGYGMGVLDEATKNLYPKTTYTYINVQGAEPVVEERQIPAADIAAIEEFAREHFNAGWTPQMKVAYTFYWIHENMIYARGGSVAPTFCVAALQKKYGQCAQYNGALVEMLCYLGYDAALIRGTRGYSAPGSQHFWGELYLNGETYVIEVGNANSDGTWCYFFVPYSFTRKFIKCGTVMGK